MYVYLLGGRRSPWHPLVMGLSTAVSHSVSLFGIAFAVHLAHHVVTGDHHHEENVSAVLPWISALLVVAVGCYLLVQAVRGKKVRCCSHHDCHEEHHHDCAEAPELVALDATSSPASAEAQAPRTSYKTTALLGMAVGLLPCPSALAAYFTGLSTGSPAAAYLIIGLFAAGIACSLTLVGLALQLFGDRLGRRFAASSRLPWAHIRALMIIGMGTFYTARLATAGM